MKDQTLDTDVIVIGAGISGLFVAHELLKNNLNVTIIEKSPFVGGLSTSINFYDCFCDIGPHFISLVKESPISNIIENFLKPNSRIELPNIHESYQVYFNNRLQNNFPTLYQFIFKNGISNFIKCIFSFLRSKIIKKDQVSFRAENYLKFTFGNYLFNNWFKPYILHTYGTMILPEKIITQKFPPITFKKILKYIRKKNTSVISNSTSTINCYPKNGMQQIIESIKEKIIQLNGIIILNADITEIDHKNQKIIKIKQGSDEKIIRSKQIVYSIPPHISIKWFQDFSLPLQRSSSLNTIIVFLIFDTKKIFNGWIINIYDPNFIFFRLSQQNFLSPNVTPNNKTILTVEIKCDSKDEVWKMNEENLLYKIKNDLKKFNFKSDFISSKIIHLPSIYPVPSTSNDNKQEIIQHINSHKNEFTVGTAAPDTGRFASSESDNNVSLGGFYVAIQDALSLINNVLSQKN